MKPLSFVKKNLSRVAAIAMCVATVVLCASINLTTRPVRAGGDCQSNGDCSNPCDCETGGVCYPPGTCLPGGGSQCGDGYWYPGCN
jgi:hypothetical protein